MADTENGAVTLDTPDEDKSATVTLENYESAQAMILKVGGTTAEVFGEEAAMDAAPIIKNSRTMLPIRIVAEGLGAKVAWNAAERKATITNGDTVIEITIDSKIAKVNGEDVVLDTPAFIENNRTYLPLRFVAENLNATVLWDAKERQVIIVPEVVATEADSTKE